MRRFSDRRYNDDGTLVNRQEPNALIQSEEEMLVHVKGILTANEVLSVQSRKLKLRCKPYVFTEMAHMR